MDSRATIQCNKLMHLEDPMVMYSFYNAETLEKLFNTGHHLHNITSPNEKLFAGQQGTTFLQSIYANAQGIQHYSINSLLYLRTVKEKYVLLYKEFITQLYIYANGIRILAKGYVPISTITPLILKEILSAVRHTVRKTNPDYNLVIKRLYLYHDMKLVTFGIDKDKNLIVQFPVFIQPYTQKLLILYQIETVPVTIIDQNMQAHLLHTSTHITIRQQKLRTCKRIGYEFYCEELFVVKHKSKYTCKSTIYFHLDPEIIKENCKFNFYYNKTDITPTVLDGGNEIILANWPTDKHIICSVNNAIPIRIPSHPYVLVNRSVLCNFGIEAENHFLLESLAACHDSISKLIMYFMVNTAFVNYLEQLTSLTESLEFPILKNKTTFKQTLPISLNMYKFDSELLTMPRNLKDIIYQYNHKNEILKKRHDKSIVSGLTSQKYFFSNNYIVDVSLFITAVISLLVTTLAIYLLCKQKKLRTLVTSLALQQVREVGRVTTEKEVNMGCKILTYMSLALTIFSLVMFAVLYTRKSKLHVL